MGLVGMIEDLMTTGAPAPADRPTYRRTCVSPTSCRSRKMLSAIEERQIPEAELARLAQALGTGRQADPCHRRHRHRWCG
jgi:hypothetical protein